MTRHIILPTREKNLILALGFKIVTNLIYVYNSTFTKFSEYLIIINAEYIKKKMVRRKIDNRIRTIIENGVTEGHRTMFVVVGDKGRDQVLPVT